MILLGWVLIPPQALLYKWLAKERKSYEFNKTVLAWRIPLMYPWGNEEDGIVNGEEFIDWPKWFRIIYWSAVRNPANNLRFIPILNVKIVPEKVKYKGAFKGLDPNHVVTLKDFDDDTKRFWYLCWQGPYSNIRFHFKMFGKIWRFWIGWKIYPEDQDGIPEWSHRKNGAGFALQFKRIHPR